MKPFHCPKTQALNIFILFLIIPIQISLCQSFSSPERLTVFEKAQKNKFDMESNLRDSLAQERGIPIFQYLDDGIALYLERFLNGEPVYVIASNAVAAHTIRTDVARQNFNLDGSGSEMGMWDLGAVFVDHPELTGGRITQMDGAPVDTANDHATHVTGTLAAVGVHPLAKGMAPGAVVRAYDVRGGDTFRMIAEVKNNDLHLSNHSYGNVAGWIKDKWYGDTRINSKIDYKFGYYDLRSQDWDSLAVIAPYYLMVKSAGNYRGDGGPIQPPPLDSPENNGGALGYDCLPTYSVAKNILTVGAVDGSNGNRMTTYSAWGPTDDGRIKPDVVAHGEVIYSSSHLAPQNKPNGYSSKTGTSHSTPAVTGSVAILMQLQQNLYPKIYLRSSTIKALLIHTSEDLGATGPDYQFGWGLVDIERAAELMVEDRTCGSHIFNEEKLDGGTPSLKYEARSGNDTLKATLCWTDPPIEPHPLDSNALNNTARRLVHDLDLRVTGPGGVSLPWTLKGLADPAAPAQPGDNIVDNVEQVIIPNPVPNEVYSINVSYKGSLKQAQNFSLIITGNCTLVANAGADKTACHDEQIQIGEIPLCGKAPFMYDWNPKDSTLSGFDIAQPFVRIRNDSLVPIVRSYFVKVSDAGGCEAIDSVTITVYPKLAVETGSDTSFCEGGQVQLRGNVIGGAVPYSYSWSPPQSLSDPSIPNPIARPSASTIYVLTVTDAKGCRATSQPLSVRVFPAPPVPSISQSEDTLESSEAYSYQWHLDGKQIPGASYRQMIALEGGSYTVVITDLNGCSVESLPFELGVCIVEIPLIEAAPGERVAIPLLLHSSKNLAAAGAQSFTASFSFNKNILAPDEQSQQSSVHDSLRSVLFSGPYIAGSNELGRQVLLAMLGHTESSVLHIDSILWNTPRIRTRTIDGEFRLRVCREGGTRLFSAARTLALQQNHPNPFNAMTIIDYEVIEAGYTELAVYDMLGRKAATLSKGTIQPGKYQAVFDASELPSGAYLAVLQTPTQRIMRMMRLLK